MHPVCPADRRSLSCRPGKDRAAQSCAVYGRENFSKKPGRSGSCDWLRVTRNGRIPELGEAGWESTDTGVQLWDRIGGTILFSGAPTPDSTDSDAARMVRIAERTGVPAADIHIEPDSLDTHQNINPESTVSRWPAQCCA
ncbi:MAG: YdcF family protein [Acidiferrobacterales bacterium]